VFEIQFHNYPRRRPPHRRRSAAREDFGWDILKNTRWNSTEQPNEVGHAMLLIPFDFCRPPGPTIICMLLQN